MVHLVVVLGVLVVLPLAFGSPRRWAVAAAAVAASFALPIGPWSGAAAAIWLVVAVWSLGAIVHGAIEHGAIVRPFDLTIGARAVAAGFATGAAGAFLASRLGLTLFGIGEPIVELTAVHFTYAGVGAVMLAAATLTAGAVDRTGAARRSGVVALALTIAAPPMVALGFVIGHALPQVGGAVVMSAGVLLTATLQLVDAAGGRVTRRAGLVVSGLAPWVPMVLAVSWAASNYWAVPALSIPDMARTHGLMNVVFVVAGLWARRSWTTAARSGTATSGDPADAASDGPASAAGAVT